MRFGVLSAVLVWASSWACAGYDSTLDTDGSRPRLIMSPQVTNVVTGATLDVPRSADANAVAGRHVDDLGGVEALEGGDLDAQGVLEALAGLDPALRFLGELPLGLGRELAGRCPDQEFRNRFPWYQRFWSALSARRIRTHLVGGGVCALGFGLRVGAQCFLKAGFP